MYIVGSGSAVKARKVVRRIEFFGGYTGGTVSDRRLASRRKLVLKLVGRFSRGVAVLAIHKKTVVLSFAALSEELQ